jgi:polyphosphate kinase 2
VTAHDTTSAPSGAKKTAANGKLKGKANGKATDKQDKIPRKVYEEELRKLQVELCFLQEWVKREGARVIVVLEGRDTAGKSGFIRVLKERVSPRVFRVVALSSPRDEPRPKLFLQRYVEQFPVAGEVVIFDRSWYNRAGVERVMGYTDEKDVKRFLADLPMFERWVTDAGIILIKLWLEIGMKEQERRFHARVHDPLRQWKLSPMDVKSYSRWYDYSRARDDMFAATNHEAAPWYVLPSDDKKRARLNGIKHILSRISYHRVDWPKVELPKRAAKHRYNDRLDLASVNVVPSLY